MTFCSQYIFLIEIMQKDVLSCRASRCRNLDFNSQQPWVPVTLPLRWRQMVAPSDYDHISSNNFLDWNKLFSESQLKQGQYQTFFIMAKARGTGCQRIQSFPLQSQDAQYSFTDWMTSNINFVRTVTWLTWCFHKCRQWLHFLSVTWSVTVIKVRVDKAIVVEALTPNSKTWQIAEEATCFDFISFDANKSLYHSTHSSNRVCILKSFLVEILKQLIVLQVPIPGTYRLILLLHGPSQ